MMSIITRTITERWHDLSGSAQDHIRVTRGDLLEQWELYEDGHHHDTVWAESVDDALDAARDGVDAARYSDVESTVWVLVEVRNVVTGEAASDTVGCDPEEPDCLAGYAHDWRSPHSIVGGLRENPGVWGHGGGVTVHEVCGHCGRQRHTDTWATGPGGVQGLTAIRYDDQTDETLRWSP